MRELGLGVGRPIPRIEDPRLLRGLGQYTDDVDASRTAVLHVVRSPHASARILSIDVSLAKKAPGVLAVLTGDDVRAENFAPFNSKVKRNRPDGKANFVPPYFPLALDIAPHAGVAVAAVIAETSLQAKDAAELVAVEYESLPAVTDTERALAPDAPIIWDEAGDNRCFVYNLGDKAAAETAFSRAAHVVRDRFVISRMTTNSMEPRGALGQYESSEGRYTLHSGLQSPHAIRLEVANVFRLPETNFHVISPDVGGAFGMKGSLYQEQILVLWAARLVGRPVRWICERAEGFLSDHQARDNVSNVELALDAEGRFLALRVQTTANIGAYIALNGLHSSTNNLGGLTGVYVIPAFDVEVTGVFSNTLPTAPFRGAGRPEASYCIERIIERAAHEIGIDSVELRRRNMIPPSAMPYKTGLVYTYDSGEFEAVMDKCLVAADWSGFEARRREAKSRGMIRGIGLACVIEISGGPQFTPMEEAVEIRFNSTGSATILAGGHSHGQGHETIYRQLATEFLGLPWDGLRVVYGDTDVVSHGRGTFGSRTMQAGGTAFVTAAQKIIERGKKIAAHLLEADSTDIDFQQGEFSVAGTDRRVSLKAVASASYQLNVMPAGAELGLEGKAVVAPKDASFPNGCHVCEVEIDPETGVPTVVRYTVVDDVGRVINPLLVKGQIHGGVAQGLGQALMEEIAFDPQDGQLLSGSFMDYGMPRASDLPKIKVVSHEVVTDNNLLGVKGAGEAGTVGALPSVMNAITNALYSVGAAPIDMPASAQKIWESLSGTVAPGDRH